MSTKTEIISYDKIIFNYYKNKHLILYVLIGVFSIGSELYIKSTFNIADQNNNYFIPFIIGVIICFTLNFFLNFNIPNYFFFVSLFYFFLISIISYSFQYYVSIIYDLSNISFEKKRFLISGFFFIFAYILHRKFSFKYIKKIGIALYPTTKTNLDEIYSQIGLYPDLIHIDMVDKSVNIDCDSLDDSNLQKIRNLWPNHEKQVHIMSKTPIYLINKYIKEKDTVFIHDDIEEDLTKVISEIKKKKAIPGIVMHIKKNIKLNYDLMKQFNEVLFLCIDKPGFSGQRFNLEAKDIIKEFNNHPLRKKMILSVDGGISLTLIPYLKSDKAISSSDILNSKKPKTQIMKLKSFSRYQR